MRTVVKIRQRRGDELGFAPLMPDERGPWHWRSCASAGCWLVIFADHRGKKLTNYVGKFLTPRNHNVPKGWKLRLGRKARIIEDREIDPLLIRECRCQQGENGLAVGGIRSPADRIANTGRSPYGTATDSDEAGLISEMASNLLNISWASSSYTSSSWIREGRAGQQHAADSNGESDHFGTHLRSPLCSGHTQTMVRPVSCGKRKVRRSIALGSANPRLVRAAFLLEGSQAGKPLLAHAGA